MEWNCTPHSIIKLEIITWSAVQLDVVSVILNALAQYIHNSVSRNECESVIPPWQKESSMVR